MERFHSTPATLADPEQGGLDAVLALPLPAYGPRSMPSAASLTSTAVSTPRTLSVSQLHTPASEKDSEKPLKQQPPPETSDAPPKPKPKPAPRKPASRWVRWQLWFNTYRKFYTFCVAFNGAVLVLAATGHCAYAANNTSAWVLGNLLIAILMRNELFGRLLYLVINGAFAKWTPLWWRLGCTSVLQHLGGIHSGCATAGFAWLVYKIVQIFINHRVNHDAVLVAGVITNILVLVSIGSAFPWVRNTHHNVFERHHRFVGWLGLVSTWIFVILGDIYDPSTHTWDLTAGRVLRTQSFWFVLGMTILVLLPWLFVREVAVDVEIPSPKVAVLRFERGMQQGLLGRISRSSILEYHAFGIVSEGKAAKYHYMVCGVQGDFTRGLVADPPKTIWTRELKFAAVGNTSSLYRRGIRVCTGTGIGAALSTCMQSPDWFLIWIGSDQEKTFGPTISGLIRRNVPPERRILWDSRKEGRRPDVMALVRETYRSFDAEVVMITSNMQGNTEIMEGCKEEGIPAFGTLWDF